MLDTQLIAPTPALDLPQLRHPTTARLFRLAQELSLRTDLWQRHVRFDQQNRVTVRIATTDDYEAWLLTWLPGQSTGLHDHGGSAGAFIVLEGGINEAVVAGAGESSALTLLHRTLTPGRARAFDGSHLHDVGNIGRVPAVSLHVYAPVLDTVRRFAVDGSGRLQVVSHERSGTDW